jgi:hypothetical protein
MGASPTRRTLLPEATGAVMDFIARLEPIHSWPDGFDHAGEIMTQAARKPEPGKRFHFAAPNFSIHRVG